MQTELVMHHSKLSNEGLLKLGKLVQLANLEKLGIAENNMTTTQAVSIVSRSALRYLKVLVAGETYSNEDAVLAKQLKPKLQLKEYENSMN